MCPNYPLPALQIAASSHVLLDLVALVRNSRNPSPILETAGQALQVPVLGSALICEADLPLEVLGQELGLVEL